MARGETSMQQQIVSHLIDSCYYIGDRLIWVFINTLFIYFYVFPFIHRGIPTTT